LSKGSYTGEIKSDGIDPKLIISQKTWEIRDKIGELMYKDQQPEGEHTHAADSNGASSNPEDAKVVDAEFEEVKEEDKK